MTFRYGVAWGVLDISDSYTTHHVSSLCQSLERCFCGLLCRDLTSSCLFRSRSGGGWSQSDAELYSKGGGEPTALRGEGASSPNILECKGDQGASPPTCLSEVPSPHHQGGTPVWMCLSAALSTGGGLSASFIQSFISCRLIQLVLSLAPDSPPPLSPSPILSLSHPSSVSSAMRIIWPWWVFLAKRSFENVVWWFSEPSCSFDMEGRRRLSKAGARLELRIYALDRKSKCACESESRLFAKYCRQPALSWFQSKAFCISFMLVQRLVIKSTSSCVPRSLLSMSHCSLTERITSWPRLRKKQQRRAMRRTNVHQSPTPAHHMRSITRPATRAWPASLPSVRETGESLKREEAVLLGQAQTSQLVPFVNKRRPTTCS